MSLNLSHRNMVPRDRELLERLYWKDGLTMMQMGDLFGVGHCVVSQVFKRVGARRPGRGAKRLKKVCRDCKVRPPKILKHKLTKGGTGTRCESCLLAYKAKWTREKKKRDRAFAEKCKADLKHWYQFGPSKPQGEKQWIRKAKHLLRTNRRLLLLNNPPASPFQSAVSAQAATSPC